MKNCTNPYCPIKYDENSDVCKDCKFNNTTDDIMVYFSKIFGK